jgi:hypothetical protein
LPVTTCRPDHPWGLAALRKHTAMSLPTPRCTALPRSNAVVGAIRAPREMPAHGRDEPRARNWGLTGNGDCAKRYLMVGDAEGCKGLAGFISVRLSSGYGASAHD